MLCAAVDGVLYIASFTGGRDGLREILAFCAARDYSALRFVTFRGQLLPMAHEEAALFSAWNQPAVVGFIVEMKKATCLA